MLRDLQTVQHKNADATRTAAVKMKFGMAVEKNYTNETVKLPTAGTKNFFFVVHDRVLYGDVQDFRSDYDPVFENIEQGQRVVLITPLKGEQYATDHVSEGLAKGDKLKVKADGTFEKDGAGSDAVAVYLGEYRDAGHKLHAVEIL